MGGRIPRQWLNVQVADAEDWASMGIWEQRFLHQGWTLSLPAPSPWVWSFVSSTPSDNAQEPRAEQR